MDDARATDPAAFAAAASDTVRNPVRRRAMLRLQARERRRQTQRLADALEHDRFTLAHTPRRRLDDDVLMADELCLHWPHADLSVAGALTATWHGVAAQRIWQWMMRRACAPAQAGAVVSVPVSGVMLGDDLADCVFTALERAELPPERLELRLPEGGLLHPSTELLLALSALRDGGVRLALEDFGMRYGSAIMLRSLPLNVVHLDPSLTHGVIGDGEDRRGDDGRGEDTHLAAGLIGMAHALGLRVVARAVDSPQRRAALLELGVDDGTGQHIAGMN